MSRGPHIPGFHLQLDDPLPIEKLVIGKPAEEVAELIPRVFNLCAAAQAEAVRLALGLPQIPLGRDQEIRREHRLRLAIILPTRLGMAPLPPERAALLAGMPEDANDPSGFENWLQSGRGAGAVLARVAALFAPGEACAELPLMQDDFAWGTPASGTPTFEAPAVDNSVAARQAAHPLMRYVFERWGPGPLWRVLARVVDLAQSAAENLPVSASSQGGWAIVPAARGRYGVRARHIGGVITEFERVTPTDHLLAPGGVLETSLANLPAQKHNLAPLLIDILDPCRPIMVQREMENA